MNIYITVLLKLKKQSFVLKLKMFGIHVEINWSFVDVYIEMRSILTYYVYVLHIV